RWTVSSDKRAELERGAGRKLRRYGISTIRCGCSSMVERQLPKLHTRVRFPSPAPVLPEARVSIRQEASMERITRRTCMAIATMGAAAAIGNAKAAAAGSDPQSLAALAKAKGLTGFGSAIGGVDQPGSAFSDLGARQIQMRECNILVPENELKWTALRPNPRDFNFHGADVLLDWAEQNGMKIRGHNLLWLRPDRNFDWLNNHDFGSRPGT